MVTKKRAPADEDFVRIEEAILRMLRHTEDPENVLRLLQEIEEQIEGFEDHFEFAEFLLGYRSFVLCHIEEYFIAGQVISQRLWLPGAEKRRPFSQAAVLGELLRCMKKLEMPVTCEFICMLPDWEKIYDYTNRESILWACAEVMDIRDCPRLMNLARRLRQKHGLEREPITNALAEKLFKIGQASARDT